MSEIEFAWDKRKSKSNAKKHGVTFAETATAFYDERATVYDDPDSVDEDRFLLLGMSEKWRMLVV